MSNLPKRPDNYLPQWRARIYSCVAILCFGFSRQDIEGMGGIRWNPNYATMRRDWQETHPATRRETMLEVWVYLFFHPIYRAKALAKKGYIFSVLTERVVADALFADGRMTAHEILEILNP